MTAVIGLPQRTIQHQAAAPAALATAFQRLFRPHHLGAVEVLLIRHGEPDHSYGFPLVSPADAPLTPLGRQQAAFLADRLKVSPVAAVYTSPARSAWETASRIAATQDLAVTLENDLREAAYAYETLEGMARGGKDLVDEITERFQRSARWDDLPGFESSRAFRRRAVAALDAAISRHPGARVAIVCHNGVINAYLSMLLGIQRDVFFLAGHASISVLRSAGDLYAVEHINDVNHLQNAVQSY